jgi:hypothetical protein
VDLVTNDIVLNVDCEEHVTPEMGEEVATFLAQPEIHAGYFVLRGTFLGGKEIRHCEWYPDRTVRLFDRSMAHFTHVITQMAGYPNAYGVPKSVGEIWTRAIGNGLIMRHWNCYGAEEPSKRSHLIPDLIRQAGQGAICLMTSGNERRQFPNSDDCADALILQRERQQPQADVTSGEWVLILTIAKRIGALMDADVVPGDKPGYDSIVSQTFAAWGVAPPYRS